MMQASAPNAVPDMQITAASIIQELADSYRKSKELKMGINNPGGAYIGWGEEPVKGNVADGSWGDGRNAAYEIAIARAEAEFAEFRAVEIATKTAFKEFGDLNATPVPPEPTSEAVTESAQSLKETIEKKALALADAELDARLRKFGLNPAAYGGKPKEERAKLLTSTFWKECLTSSVREVAGVRILQTFEGVGKDGNWAVGVLIVQTPKMTQLANTISQGRAARRGLYPPDKAIEQQVKAADVELLNDFGVRTLIDENGDPCIIAFGQCPIPNAQSDAVIREMQANQAGKIARMQAQSAVAQFANGVVETQAMLNLGEHVEAYVDGGKKLDYFKQLNDSYKKTAKLNISGLTAVRKFRAKHPKSGQEFVGVVMAWSPTSQEQAKRSPLAPLGQPAGPGGVKAGGSTGNDYDKKIKDW